MQNSFCLGNMPICAGARPRRWSASALWYGLPLRRDRPPLHYRLEDIDAFHASRVRRNTSEITKSRLDSASKCRFKNLPPSGGAMLQTASEAECLTDIPARRQPNR